MTKLLALHFLNESIPVVPGVFHFTLVHNHGIAFGLFARFPWVLLVLVSISLVVLIWIAHRPAFNRKFERILFGLILGGAFGNWVDRVKYGAVIDFLDFRIWPVFNLADSAISIGVGIYLIYLLKNSTKK